MSALSPALIATIEKYLRYLAEAEPDEYTQGTIDGVKETLRLLGIKLEEETLNANHRNAFGK